MTETDPTASRARDKHVVAIGGGRGGVGKTLLAVNLAVYLAQLGRHVVLCDADPSGSNLHTELGLDHPPFAPPGAVASGEAEPVATSVPGLHILPIAYDLWTVAPKKANRKSHWQVPIDKLDADYVVLNLGAATQPSTLDVFYEAHVSMCVSAPEPTAIEATYRFCRALFARRLRRALLREKFRLRAVERALVSLGPLPTPRALIAELARFDEGVANIATAQLESVRPGLVIGKTRLRKDLGLGPAMAAMSERYLGIGMDYLGYIEHDDAVWLTARRRRPLLIDAPTAKAARNIERVARRVLTALAQPRKPSFGLPQADASTLNAPMTLYDTLGVERTASDEEIRRAHKLQRAIFTEDSLPIISLVNSDGMRVEQARIAEAYDTLLDPSRRLEYDRSVFPNDPPEPASERARTPSITEAELAQLQAEIARDITPETQFTGALLARAREARGIEIQDIAQETKIAPMHLRAIEAEDFQTLPAQVYVRGFLQQLAKSLKLDPTQVTRTYLKRVRSVRADYK